MMDAKYLKNEWRHLRFDASSCDHDVDGDVALAARVLRIIMMSN